jgi:hypothetical protein
MASMSAMAAVHHVRAAAVAHHDVEQQAETQEPEQSFHGNASFRLPL